MSFRFIFTAFLLLSLVKPSYAGCWRPSCWSNMRDHSNKHAQMTKDDDVIAVRPVSSWRGPAHADHLLQDEEHGGRRRTSHSKEALGSESSERSSQKIMDAQQSEEYIRGVALTSSWN